ncbi:hypothetical protein HYALB_00013337 [Hymenoscyphus albidus]|uniref:Uncharacterized protein n=1 Tax=Hymenoscyphus albidus TaxID=595503 RepID=A0A9N9Q9F9_9HELO|nr:hypothetical protein HYALB_00013337 [Hymenoscyphus albidus]
MSSTHNKKDFVISCTSKLNPSAKHDHTPPVASKPKQDDSSKEGTAAYLKDSTYEVPEYRYSSDTESINAHTERMK